MRHLEYLPKKKKNEKFTNMSRSQKKQHTGQNYKGHELHVSKKSGEDLISL
jgi:hypothetical protein